LSGAWETDAVSLPLATQEGFWRQLFETPSLPDPRLAGRVREVAWGLLTPVTAAEVSACLKEMSTKTAPGPDGRTLDVVRKLPLPDVVARLNLWLLAGCVPTDLYDGYTTLIPKQPGADNPAFFRPITVTSVLIRLLHKTVAKRFDKLCPASERQKAFRSGDGLAENVNVLKTVLKTAQDPKRLRSVYVAFLDVRKAFDSVSHHSILLAAERAGCPAPLLEYIRNFYATSTTRVRSDGQSSERISVRQGVKQGDPLSCILFNLVIDWALAELDGNIGFKLGSVTVNHLAFADDVVLLAETPAGLQNQINKFSAHLARSGLMMNAGKCATLSIVANLRKKQWRCDPVSFARLGTELIPALPINEAYKYLGIHVSATGASPVVEEKLKAALRNLSRAPLKPQQRLFILKSKVIPSLFHQLVLSDTSRGFLAYLDRTIRAAVRGWTRLPKDTPIPAFYARAKDGGLGLQALEHVVPAMKAKRLQGMAGSLDPVVRQTVQQVCFQQQLRRWSRPTLFKGLLMSSPSLRHQAYAHHLYASVDGRGLKHASLEPCVHDWVTSGTSLLTGAKFNAALGVRLGTLPTRLRASRGRPEANGTCDCCGPGQLESLSHIQQVCPRTHHPRVKRHDRVLDQAARMFRRLGYDVVAEPHFKTGAGLRKPDLLVYKPDQTAYVVDVTIHSDMYDDPNAPHRAKVEKYAAHPEIVRGVEVITGVSPTFSAIAISWRGCMSPASAADLRRLGLKAADLGLLAAITVEQGTIIHRLFNMSTFVPHH
jgi:hypothetical protein